LDEGFESNGMKRKKKLEEEIARYTEQWPNSDACKLKSWKNIDQKDDISIHHCTMFFIEDFVLHSIVNEIVFFSRQFSNIHIAGKDS
jgi:hypothetical protein